MDHFIKNQDVIDHLKSGQIIEFVGHVTRLQYKTYSSQQNGSDEHNSVHLNVFEVTEAL